MRIYITIVISVIFATLLSLLVKNIVKRINRKIWKFSKIDTLIFYLPFAAFVCAVIWTLGRIFVLPFFMSLGAVGIISVFLFDIMLLLTLPFSWMIDFINVRIQSIKLKYKKEKSFNPERRKLIKAAAAALPLFAVGTTGTGLASSFQQVCIRKITLYFEELPEDLDGFKILHFSDLHLGIYFQLSDLENVVENGLKEKPDIFLVTGDVSDDLRLLPDALKLISQLNTSYHGYVSLGNHEYYRGIKESIQKFVSGPIPLLINKGEIIKIGNSKLFLGGADDPVTLRSDVTPFLKRTVEKTMKSATEDSFNILMSHRPKTLDVVENQKINLILSGHTHGGQVGFNGRSLFEGMIEKEPYLWGKYKKGNTQLYTSAGMGHWFPFRFNCPPEAPLIILKKLNS
jgi:predicted MPP superfamily phosphohydrolase